MHPIQSHVIGSLVVNSYLGFSKLKPKNVEGNLFMYHLKKLLDEDLVVKIDGVYKLTSKGALYADKLSLDSLKPRIQPKIVTLVACKNDKGEYLMYLRKREPFFGLIGFPYGKIHLGETIQQAAERELKEKNGLSAKLKHRGDVYITVYKDNELVSQMFCHVFGGENAKGQLKENSVIGRCNWQKIDKLTDSKFMPGFADIFKLLKKGDQGLFFDEFVYHV